MSTDLIEDAIDCLRGGGWDNEADAVAGLVTEISRLQTQVENCHAAKNLHARRSEKLQEQLAAKDALNNDLMTNCNQLRDRCWKAESELARWQNIAIGAKAEAIYNLYWQGVITEHPTQSHQMPVYCDLDDKTKYQADAAKELNLQVTREAGYVDRLKKKFLDHLAARIYYESIPYVSDYWSWHDYPEEPCQMKPKQWFRDPAHAALNKIREGK